MKVAFFLGSLNRGGAETLLADMFAQGKALPFEAVCIYRKEGTLSDAFHATEVPMHRLPRKRSWLLYGLKLRRLVKSERVDILHAQSAFNATLAIIFLAFTPVRIVLTLHGAAFNNANKLYKRFVFRHCLRLICVSESERAKYLAHPIPGVADRFVVVPNGINFNKFGYSSSTGEGTVVRMCMVGNFVPEKNQYLICQALKELASQGVSFDFSFIGARVPAYGACYDRCVSYCEQNGLSSKVHFLGSRNDVPELLSGMDVFVYSSKSETFGIAVVEAMAMGLPTFVNDLEVFDEITHNGEFAVLYKSDNVPDLCEKIQDYLHNRPDYHARAQANASVIRSRYSIATHTTNLQSIYSQMTLV